VISTWPAVPVFPPRCSSFYHSFKSTGVFWDVTPCSPVGVNPPPPPETFSAIGGCSRSDTSPLHSAPGSQISPPTIRTIALLFYPEDGSSRLLRHGATFLQTVIFSLIAARTSNLTALHVLRAKQTHSGMGGAGIEIRTLPRFCKAVLLLRPHAVKATPLRLLRLHFLIRFSHREYVKKILRVAGGTLAVCTTAQDDAGR
jgi:hypothetical protein